MQERKIGDDIAIVSMTKEELRQFVASEVARALGDRETLDKLCEHCTARIAATTRIRAPYLPRGIEYKSKPVDDNPDLPQWARNGNWS